MKMHHWSDSPTLRFTAPVIAENMATTSINMVVSSIIGGISASALAGVGLVNSFLNVITAAAAFLTTGAAVLVARIAGEGDERETSRAVGQAFLLAVLFGVAIMAICEILSAPIVKLMMNSSDENVLREGLIYYRTMIASFPLLLIANTMGGALRATGDAAPVMRGMIVMNLVQLLCVWLFVGRMGMEVAGAGLAHGVCRLTGAGLMIFACATGHRKFRFRIRTALKPDRALIKRISRLGIPTMTESVSVQLAYLIANSMAMGLGTHEAGVYQVANTLNSFTSLPQSISSVAVITLVGQALGAKYYQRARKLQRNVLTVALICSMMLATAIAAFGFPLAGLYTRDASVQAESARLMWLMTGFALFGTILNANDPVLRTAGDVKYVMAYTMFSVWLVRLPLTYLMAYVLKWGAFGVQLANILSLAVRAAFDLCRIHKGKWLYLKV